MSVESVGVGCDCAAEFILGGSGAEAPGS
jgi:hypothetical protein